MKTRLLIIIGIILVSIGSGTFVYYISIQDQCDSQLGDTHYPRPLTLWNCLDYLRMIQENPQSIPEPVSEGIPAKKFMPHEESFEGVFGTPVTESEFDSIISYTPVKLSKSNAQNLELIEIRINTNTNVHYLYSSQTINLNELKNKQDFFDAGGVVVETVYLTNPNGTYTRLANDVNFEIEYLGTVPTRYHFYPEEYNSLLLYPDNQRLVYIQSIADIDKIKQLASDIKLKNDFLNLDDYLDSNWRLLEPTPES